MSTSAFRTIEDELRFFLFDVCVLLAEDSKDCLFDVFGTKYSDFNQLEFNDFCYFLSRMVDHNNAAKLTTLFGRQLSSRSLIFDIRFVGGLRNKYSHQNGNRTFHSDEQLADMLVVRRLVRELGRVCAFELPQGLSRTIENTVNELVKQTAQVAMPNQFDTEGEKNALSEEDKEFIRKLFNERMLPTLSHSAAAESPNSQPLDDAFEILRNEMSEQFRKIRPVTALKGRIDSMESDFSVKLASITEAVRSLEDKLTETFEALNENNGDSDGRGGSEDENDFWEDDIDAEDEDEEEDLPETHPSLVELRDSIKELQESFVNAFGITQAQARDELISLRKRIWRETRSGPSGEGLLRKSMIDNFLYYLPESPEAAHDGAMSYWLSTVDSVQLGYLDDVCQILRRVKQ